MIQSRAPSASATGRPTEASSGSTQMPECSSPSPSSRSEQIMPRDSTPRILAFLSLKSPGSTVPTRPTATFCPCATLGAPQTMPSGSPSPTSTRQALSLSALGCGARSIT